MKKYEERINFYDCDPAGILFFANIFRLAHKSYEQFLSEISPERNFFDDDSVLLPIIHSEADYLKPLTAGSDVTVEVTASVVKKSSFELTYNISKGETLYGSVKTVHVAVDKKSFAKTELPPELKMNLLEHSS